MNFDKNMIFQLFYPYLHKSTTGKHTLSLFWKKNSIIHLYWYVGIFDIYIQLCQNGLKPSQKVSNAHQNITEGHHCSIWVFVSVCIYDICLHWNFHINWSVKNEILQIGYYTEVKTRLDILDYPEYGTSIALR